MGPPSRYDHLFSALTLMQDLSGWTQTKLANTWSAHLGPSSKLEEGLSARSSPPEYPLPVQRVWPGRGEDPPGLVQANLG